MNEKHLNSWEEFEAEVQRLQTECEAIRKSADMSVSGLLFRGQGNDSWSLKTTLDRCREEPWSVINYLSLASKVCPQIETFTGSSWQLEDFPKLQEWVSEHKNVLMKPLPWYDYFVYLRHHGFPSPFLDWTRSPYIAAYFAFAQSRAQSRSKRVAVYVYWEFSGYGKSGWVDDARIRSFGSHVRSHKRHFLQQSEYTISVKCLDDKSWYAPHEEAFANAPETQDKLWKFTMPAGERCKVLKILDAFNLNEFSLFQTEEALLSTIAVRELELNS